MRRHIYLLFNIVLAFGFVACDKAGETIDENDGAVITFAPKTVKTRALINNVTDLHSHTLRVFDFWDGQTSGPYINNTLLYSQSNSTWQYGTTPDPAYTWKAGTHKFFSYIDGTGTYDSSAKTLSVSKSLTASDDEVDVLYSDVYSTTAAEWMATKTPETPVPLTFKHLLSSIGMVVKNCTDGSVTVNSVTTVIPNKGSATINFGGDATAVAYGDEGVTPDETTPFISADNPITDVVDLPAEGFIDVLSKKVFNTGTDAVDTSYFVIWPQTIDTLKVDVKYTINDGSDVVTYEKTVKIPDIEWVAGNKYTYTLNISPTDILLIFKVQPWDEGPAGDLDTKDGSINMSAVTWMNTKVRQTATGEEMNTVDIDGYKVNMYYQPYVLNGTEWTQYTTNNGYFPAQGYFTINYPMDGKFKIGLIPAYGETTVDTSKYTIVIYNQSTGQWVAHDQTNGEDITQKTVYFQVRSTSSASGPYKAQIDIWVKPDGGEWISAYSEIRANYALVIPAHN